MLALLRCWLSGVPGLPGSAAAPSKIWALTLSTPSKPSAPGEVEGSAGEPVVEPADEVVDLGAVLADVVVPVERGEGVAPGADGEDGVKQSVRKSRVGVLGEGVVPVGARRVGGDVAAGLGAGAALPGVAGGDGGLALSLTSE